MKNHEFLNIKLTKKTIDRYFIRSSIFNAIKKHVGKFDGKFLDAGCGKMPYKEFISTNSTISNYIGLDIETALEYEAETKPDVTWDGIKMPFNDGEFKSCMATEVMEHCPDPKLFMREVNRVLEKEGLFFFTVPFLWNFHEVPHDEYRYTPFSLKRLLEESNFHQVELWATGGWHASMGQMLGLWINRSGLNHRLRWFLLIFIKPIMKILFKKDSGFHQNFREGQMVPSLFGIARKA